MVVLALLSISLFSGRYWTIKQYDDFAKSSFPYKQLVEYTKNNPSSAQVEKRQIFLAQLQHHTSNVVENNKWQLYQNCQLFLSEGNRDIVLLDLYFPLLKDDVKHTDLYVGCSLKTSSWFLSVFIASLLIFLLWITAPRPLNQQNLMLFQLLTLDENCRLSQFEIKSVLLRFTTNVHINSQDLCYLHSRLDKQAITTPKALELLLQDVVSPLELKFSVKNDEIQVSLSNLNIEIASTPAIYWLWYANYRKLHKSEGWITNPPSNRPDTQLAQELISLMKQYGGHARALKELEQHGLRAKTLDKNRNRIKEALNNHLPPELAGLCGFETIKRPDSNQSAYRLRMEAKSLILL
ncbi:hypothetical protein [Vibrio natriegens]|uniref:hypothetical protein n=1 Tax=Vibrio natriegens TaxID=691 RepID=UPI0012D795F7|nr:hypothetical protein [Vibrio natriegens]WRS50899.1 hypothetical protein VER99_15335 [Vibrio natriegens NBRC 15636 = ATCC 14048 = DSM 759]